MCRTAHWSLSDLNELDIDELRYWYQQVVDFKKALDKAEKAASKVK